ncbi:MAG: cytochrome c maturation protein CcmE [Proteobacteria bacterium]|nr:cytochrome c maturation protein CcmE [Pseudomonadota bacterium]
MKPKRRRLYYVLAGMATLGVAAALVLTAFQDNLVFFNSPTDVYERNIQPDTRFRLGGLVVEDSIRRQSDGLTTVFEVTDLIRTVQVSYTGILPSLFREGQGVVTDGSLDARGVFIASQVLAKHDETYLPREVVESLKKSGKWQGQGSGEANAQ